MAALTEKRVELLERALGPLTKRNRQLVVMGLDLSIEYDMYSVSFVDSAEGMRMEFRRRSAQERADGVEALPPNVAAAANEAAERKKAAAAAAAAKAAARTDAPGQKTNESMVRADAADKADAATQRFTVKEPAKASAKAEKRKAPSPTSLVEKNTLSACGGGGGGGRVSPPCPPHTAKSPRTSEHGSEYETDEETAAVEVAALQRRAAERGGMHLPGRQQEEAWQEVRRSRSRSPPLASLPSELAGLPVGSKEREVAQSLANDAARNMDSVQRQRSEKALQGLVRAARARAQPKPAQPAGRGKGRAG